MSQAPAVRPPKSQRKPDQAAVEFRVLGTLEVLRAGTPIALGGPKQRLVLAMLILEANRVVSADRLVDQVWGDEPSEAARGTLQAYISRLRQALTPIKIEARGPGYVLEVNPDQIDASRFERLVENAKALPPEERAAELTKALRMWRGTAFADFASRPFALGEAARLNELRMHALEGRIDADLALGRHGEVVGELESLVTEHPLRERLCGQLMLALYRSGRQAEASAVYQKTRLRLVDELGMEPGSELQSLLTQILKQDAALLLPTATADRRGSHLPLQLTSFLGREGELKQVVELIRRSRLVSLIGPGGVGKTRLAIEAARVALDSNVEIESVFFVDLAPLRAAELLEQTVITAIGGGRYEVAASIETIVAQLGSSRPLIVFDNCEHLIDPVARLVDQLLRKHHGVRVLATSREPLRVASESRWPVSELSDEEGVLLFMERAQLINPRFATGAEAKSAITKLCHGLDGLPLAIELAAARVGQMSIGEIVGRIDDRFGLLTETERSAPARHGSLEAAIDWSYELLSDIERNTFMRLSVFAGGFDVTAAEAVAGCTVGELGHLVEKSIVALHGVGFDGRARYRLLETLRQYGYQRLKEAGLADQALNGHFDYFAGLVNRAAPELNGRDLLVWLQRLGEDTGNLRAALEFGIARDADTALAMAVNLEWFWLHYSQNAEGRWWLLRLISAAATAPPATMAAALAIAADLGLGIGESDAPRAELAQALNLRRQINDHAGISRTLVQKARAEGLTPAEFAAQRRLLEEALVEARQANDDFLVMEALSYLGLALSFAGDFDEGRARQTEAEAIARQTGVLISVAWVMWRDAAAYLLQGDLLSARVRCEEGMKIFQSPAYPTLLFWPHALMGRVDFAEGRLESARARYRQLGNGQYRPYTVVQGLAVVAARSGEFLRALKLGGAASAIPASTRLLAFPEPEFQHWMKVARNGLDPEAADQAWRTGATMTVPELFAYAVSDADGDSTTP